MQLNVNGISIGFFLAFMVLTLLITYWAAKRITTTEQFFAADGKNHGLAKWLGARRRFLISCGTPRYRWHHHRERFRWNDLFDRVARRLADYVVSDC